jgi:hypothetical protein
VTISGTLSGDWLAIRVGKTVIETQSVAETLTLYALTHITFNLRHPIKCEAIIELFEFVFGIRKKTFLAGVKSIVPMWL